MAKKKLSGFPVDGQKLISYFKHEFGSVTEAARYYGFHFTTVYQWARKGAILWEAAGKLHCRGIDVRDLAQKINAHRI